MIEKKSLWSRTWEVLRLDRIGAEISHFCLSRCGVRAVLSVLIRIAPTTKKVIWYALKFSQPSNNIFEWRMAKSGCGQLEALWLITVRKTEIKCTKQSYQRIVSTHSQQRFFAQYETNYDSVACINFSRMKLELNTLLFALQQLQTANDIFLLCGLVDRKNRELCKMCTLLLSDTYSPATMLPCG